MTIQQWPVSTKAAVQIDAMEQMVGATLDDVRNIDNMVRNTVLATLSFDHICNWTLILRANLSTANSAKLIVTGFPEDVNNGTNIPRTHVFDRET